MKKITNLLIVCSLALAGAVIAQQPTPEESQAPGKKADKKAPAEVKPNARGPKSETPAAKEPAAAHAPKAETPAVKEPAAVTEATTAPKADKKGPGNKKSSAPATTAPETKTEQPAMSATPADKKDHATSHRKNDKVPAATTPATTPAAPTTATTPATAKTTATPAVATSPKTAASPTAAAASTSTTPATTTASATPATATASTTPATSASASAAPSVAAQTSPAASVNPAMAAKKPDPAKVEQIKQQHASFRATARPDRVPAVTFSANYRLPGVEQWQGPQYEVYRSYRPERHDQAYYRSRYQRVELIGGGYYYFNNGYWYPAWGYNPSNEYYAYDAPIYVGKHAEPPDKVIANVQAVLQEMGYYRGEVDGLLGPLTREALTGYQRDHGMMVTAVIDEPTLESLDMG